MNRRLSRTNSVKEFSSPQAGSIEGRPPAPAASRRRVEWTYNAKGRRIRQKTTLWTNSTWVVVEDLKFIADPMSVGRHIAELNATNNALVRSYVWGLDLSGSLDGAGGVGGPLWVRQHSGSAAGVHFCAYDGNGNIVGLVSAKTGTETARYEYAPFGEPIRVTGPMAKDNPFRFSTKRTDNTTDLVLYEYRVYSPTLGRWLSRDPIGEMGGRNLYGLVGNAIPNRIDLLGLKPGKPCCENACEVLGAVEIVEVLPILLPGSQQFGEPYVLDQMAEAIKVLITIACRGHSTYIKEPGKIVVDLARDPARQKDIDLTGIQIYTVLVYRKCERGRCGGFIGAIKSLLGKCSRYHWVVYETEPRKCKPKPSEEHIFERENFMEDAVAGAVPRCTNEHQDEFNRLRSIFK